MTVLSTINRNDYTADGVQTVFAYTYLLYDAEHMQVFLDGVATPTGWSVDGLEDPAGGNVTFLVAPADGVVVTLLRIVPLTQLIDYVEYDPLPAEVLEKEADLDVMRAQQATEFDQRVLYYDINDVPPAGSQLPAPEPGTVIGYDVAGNLTNIVVTSGGTYNAVRDDGTLVSQNRTELNFISGNDIDIQVVDNVAEARTDITIISEAAGGPGGPGDVQAGVPFVIGDLLEVIDNTADNVVRTAVRAVDGRGLQVDNIPLLDFANSFSKAQFVDGVGDQDATIGVVETTFLEDATLSAWGGRASLSLRATDAALPTQGLWHQFRQFQDRLFIQRNNFATGIIESSNVLELFSNGGFVLGGASLGTQGAGTLNATGLYVNGVPVNPALQGSFNEVTKDGSTISTNRRILEFQDTGDATVTVTDDGPNNRVIISIDATGGAGGGGVAAGATFDLNEVTFVSGTAGDGEISTSGLLIADVVSNAGTGTTDNFASFSGASGKVIQDSGVSLASLDLRYLQNVIEDTTPQLGGDLESKGNLLRLTRSDDSLRGALSALDSIDGSALAYLSGAGYTPGDGAFVVRSGIAEIDGTSALVNNLKHSTAGGEIVYVAENGTLFSIPPTDQGWQTDAEDAGVYGLGTGGGTGPWTAITGAAISPVEDVLTGESVIVAYEAYIVNGSSNQSGQVEFGMGINGADPLTENILDLHNIAGGFDGPVAGNRVSIASADRLTSDVFTLFARRLNGAGGAYAPTVTGTSEPSRVAAAKPGGGEGSGGDVFGPAGVSADGNIALYNGTSGKLIKDGPPSANLAFTDVGNIFTVDQFVDANLTMTRKDSNPAVHAVTQELYNNAAQVSYGGASVAFTLRAADGPVQGGTTGFAPSFSVQQAGTMALNYLDLTDSSVDVANVSVYYASGGAAHGTPLGGDPGVLGVHNFKGVQVEGVNVAAGRITEQTFMVLGEITASTAVGKHFVKLATGEFKRLVGVRASIESGTSIAVEVTKNGTGLGANWLGTVTTTPADFTGGSETLVDNDYLGLEFAAPVGTPTIVSVTLFIESLGA